MPSNPLKQAMAEWLPELDFGIMHHGFAPHGRDYVLVIEVPAPGDGTVHEMSLTHVVALTYETRVRDDVWPNSWEDSFTDYAAWTAAGEPDGYVWGTNWSLAYPGLSAPDQHPLAQSWSDRLAKPMYFMMVETDRFQLSMVFHGVKARLLPEIGSTVSRTVTPLPPR